MAVLDEIHDLAEEFGRRVVDAAASIERRFGLDLTESRRDQLLACYVLGLTAPFYETQPPQGHLLAMRSCLNHVMLPERVERALDAVTDVNEGWSRALSSVEAIGHKEGHAIFMKCTNASGANLPKEQWAASDS